MKKLLFIPALAFSVGLSAQSLSPQVIASSGGYFSNGSGSLSWTLGETMTETFTSGSNQLTQGFQQPNSVLVNINIKAFLSGPFVSASSNMADDLRTQGLIPLTEPYTGLGFTHVSGGGETIAPAVLSVTGNDAIVDWVFLELRNKLDDTDVLATRCALVQVDGDIVDVDGVSAVEFDAAPDDYFICVDHRNHLAIMSFNTIALGDSPIDVDFTDGSTATYGTNAQAGLGAVDGLYNGDVVDDGVVKYTGFDNDRDKILTEIGGSIPTNTTTGYKQEDANLDGVVKYTGLNNDRDLILTTIGGTVPTNTVIEQKP